MKFFISQPMSGRLEKDIMNERMDAINELLVIYGRKDTEILNSYFTDEHRTDFEDTFGDSIITFELYWLSQALEIMAEADVVVMVGNWRRSKGCKIERICAKQYGIPIIYMK